MEDTSKNQSATNQNSIEEISETEESVWIKEDSQGCPNDDNLLNLIAEIVVENIVKKLRNGCNRIHQDQ